MKSQIYRAVEAHTLPLGLLPNKMPTTAETEDMLRISADFCLHSGQMKLISIYETSMTSTIRGKLMVSRSDHVGLPNLTQSVRSYREKML